VKEKYTYWTLLVYLMVFIPVNMAYWMCMFNVPSYGGNLFVNGMLLGAAEASSGTLSGILIAFTSTKKAFLICSVGGMVFSTLNQFFTTPGSLISYTTLFLAIFGIGGMFNCMFVLVNLNVPTDKVGRVSTLGFGMSYLGSAVCPFIVLLP
jgi:hypothetical protein